LRLARDGVAKVDQVGFDDDPIEGSIAAGLEEPVAAAPAMSAAPTASATSSGR
jgi:hypothetical protein